MVGGTGGVARRLRERVARYLKSGRQGGSWSREGQGRDSERDEDAGAGAMARPEDHGTTPHRSTPQSWPLPAGVEARSSHARQRSQTRRPSSSDRAATQSFRNDSGCPRVWTVDGASLRASDSTCSATRDRPCIQPPDAFWRRNRPRSTPFSRTTCSSVKTESRVREKMLPPGRRDEARPTRDEHLMTDEPN